MNDFKIGEWVTVHQKDGTPYPGNIAKHGTIHKITDTHVEVILEVPHHHMNTYYFPMPYEWYRVKKHDRS